MWVSACKFDYYYLFFFIKLRSNYYAVIFVI